jgi:hypothetical protein
MGSVLEHWDTNLTDLLLYKQMLCCTEPENKRGMVENGRDHGADRRTGKGTSI